MASPHHAAGPAPRTADLNTPGRLAFWMGLISIPFGPMFGVPAIVAGLMGLRRQSTAPTAHGTRNAWIGIALGILSTALWLWIAWSLGYAGDDNL